MPTLEGFNGASLAPDIMGALNRGAGAFQAVRQIGRQNAADDAVTAAMTGDQDALARLAALNPQVAGVVSNIVTKKDEKAALKLQQEAQEMARYAGFALQTDPAQRAQALVTIGQEFQKQGRDVAPIVNILRMPPEQQELELKRILATQASLDDVYKQQFGGAVASQFGAQETFKDEKGNLFFGTTRRNPSTGMVDSVLAPVGGGDARPVGRVQLVGNLGLTATEQVSQKGAEAAATAGAETAAAQERELQRVLGKEAGSLYANYQQAAQAASQFLPRLEDLQRLAATVETGATAEIRMLAKRSLGLDSANMEELNAKLGELAQDILNQQTGTKTDFDFQNAVRQSASLGKTPEANRRLIEALIERQRQAVRFGDMAREALQQRGAQGVLDLRYVPPAQGQQQGATTAPAPAAPAGGTQRMRFNPATGRLEPSQ